MKLPANYTNEHEYFLYFIRAHSRRFAGKNFTYSLIIVSLNSRLAFLKPAERES